MNKFITLALIAICATMAQAQVIGGYPSGIISQLNQQSGGSSAASAAASASSSSASNNAQQQLSSVGPAVVSPLGLGLGGLGLSGLGLGGLGLGGIGIGGPYLSGLAGLPVGAQYINQLATPLVNQVINPINPYLGYPVGAIGPCGQGLVY